MKRKVDHSSRKIIHIDMDAFYASVEQMDHPELKGRPVIVGGSVEARGVVSAASYEARAFGVRSAMPTRTALKLCPEAVFIPCRFDRYEEVSHQIFEIFRSYTPLVEPLSLDEAFLDVTGSVSTFDDAVTLARETKGRIRKEVGLVASVGVAPNKFLAKIASDLKKPDGFFVIRPGDEKKVLEDLPIRFIWGVGEVTERALRSLGLKRIGQIRSFPRERLEQELGSYARTLLELSLGIDESEVIPEREAKSIGSEETFPRDIREKEILKKHLQRLCEEVSGRLREANLQARTVHIKVRFSNFRTITRSRTLKAPTDLFEVIWQSAKGLLEEKVRLNLAVRLIGVSVSNLSSKGPEQLSLFPGALEKTRRVEAALDKIRKKHGEESIRRGSLLDE